MFLTTSYRGNSVMCNQQKSTAPGSNKIMSAAFKKILDFRDLGNQGRERILADDLSCAVYVYTSEAGYYCVVAYRGRAKKPAFHYRYPTAEARDKKVSEWMEEQSSFKKERQKREMRRLAVGDVLCSSWGYEQTNIDYYMVTLLVGETMVELVEIGQHREYTDSMQGTCTPDPARVIGKPFRRRVDGEAVKISSYASAFKVEKVAVDGVLKYPPSSWTSYA